MVNKINRNYSEFYIIDSMTMTYDGQVDTFLRVDLSVSLLKRSHEISLTAMSDSASVNIRPSKHLFKFLNLGLVEESEDVGCCSLCSLGFVRFFLLFSFVVLAAVVLVILLF